MIKVWIGNNMGRHDYPIDENTTLRQALESHGVDYSRGMTSLDGCTLAPGDLDKTFADFGINSSCFLMNVVKADNAASVRIFGQACVVESEYTVEDIAKLEKFRPNALTLYQGDGKDKELVFAVGTTKGKGSIGKFGASFGSNSASSGKAAITMMIPEGVNDAKKWAVDTIGKAIIDLKTVEDQYAAALADVDAEQATIEAAITVG